MLFNLVLEFVIRRCNQRYNQRNEGVNLSNINITKLAYADDIDVMGETLQDVQRTSTRLVEESKQVGLECNEQKTKIMLMDRREDIEGQDIRIGQLTIEGVNSFKYLGTLLTSNNDINEEVRERIAAGSRCLYALKSIFGSRKLSRKTKLRVYNVVVKPVVLYGCEAWTLTEERKRKLEVFENGVLRRILGPVFDEEEGRYRRRHNREIRELTEQTKLQNEVVMRRLRYAGHCARMSEERIPKKVLNAQVQGTRPLGRPRYRWNDNIKQDVKEIIDNPGQWQEEAQDRRQWRGLALAVMGHLT